MSREWQGAQQAGGGEPPPLRCAEAGGCQICQGSLPDEHEHVLDTEYGVLMCACAACAEVFAPRQERDRAAAQQVPRHRRWRPLRPSAG